METKPNDFTFPHSLGDITQYQHIDCGLTKREYFAVMALQGILSGVSGVEQLAHVHPASWSETAVQYADTLIAELNKKEAQNG